jgi:hypothetical protein
VSDNADELRRWLEKKQRAVVASGTRANYRVAQLVKDTAVKYAPKSPTQKEKNKGKARKRDSRGHFISSGRSSRSTSRATPGGLMRSISAKSTEAYAEIFVAANSEAGKYAFGIHELKGKVWRKRGIGTIAKGAKADDKFITRAIDDRAKDITAIHRDAIDKALRS